MQDTALQFLTGVLGIDGARALARTADREPALEPLLVPRAALAWLRERPDFEGLIPGQRNSYLSFQKSEQGYAGVVSLAETNYEFLAASPEHLAAAIALAVGVDPALRHPVRDLTLARLGKSIDALARAHDLAKALPKSIQQKMAIPSSVVAAHAQKHDGTGDPEWVNYLSSRIKSHPKWALVSMPIHHLDSGDPRNQDVLDEYASMPAETAPAIIAVPGNGGPYEVLDGGHRIQAAQLRGDTHVNAYVPSHLKSAAAHKTELPGKTAQPRGQQGPEGPQAPQMQPQMPKPKLPRKMPGLRVEKSETGAHCPICDTPQFRNGVFTGCICLRDLAKHVRTVVYSDGVVLEFKPSFPINAWSILRKNLKGENS